jgi:multicomponent Na+:H+ antiporter subunit B
MAVAATALGALYVWGATGLPDFGDTVSVTGTTISHAVGSDRQVTNAVSAIVFDYRGFDTLGEELILFVSVVAVALLVREQRDEEERIAPDVRRAETAPGGSDAVRVAGLAAIGVTSLVGLYVVAHGQLTPGGGFQGGAILGSALIAVYAAGDMLTLRAVRPRDWMDLVHALGAAGLLILALGGLVAGGAFFHNFLPTGHSGSLLSGGTIGLGNVAVGLEVVGASAMLVAVLMQDTMIAHRPEDHA